MKVARLDAKRRFCLSVDGDGPLAAGSSSTCSPVLDVAGLDWAMGSAGSSP